MQTDSLFALLNLNYMSQQSLPHPKPAHFTEHSYRRTFEVTHSPGAVWHWLNLRSTFTDNQVWPYRVEFLAADGSTLPGEHFTIGEYNIHHGPLMSFGGVIAAMDTERYRDLQYSYGSYFLSMRLIRPTRLQFWLEGTGAYTQVTLQIDSYAHPRIGKLWSQMQGIFWGRFGRWANRDVGKVQPGLALS